MAVKPLIGGFPEDGPGAATSRCTSHARRRAGPCFAPQDSTLGSTFTSYYSFHAGHKGYNPVDLPVPAKTDCTPISQHCDSTYDVAKMIDRTHASLQQQEAR